ncbi:MAG: hypothetical protein WCR61_05835 [Bacteroidales bacterium]|nr:hypothetical protein [Bacteroidales bacterium]MDD4656385.1 hypothetical protein [Bacteroidales bacterium]
MTNNKDPNKTIIDNFIKQELEIKPNPFLAAKVMAKIVAQENEFNREPAISLKERKTYKLAFNLAMSVGAAAVLALGVFLGNSYTSKESLNTQTNNSLAINDTQLENLHLYNLE